MSFTGIRLTHDPIREALLEIRFETTTVPEAVIGRLTDVAEWESFEVSRLPAADIPHPFRIADPNLKFSAHYELKRAGAETIRIGPNVISYHRYAPYPGWEEFYPALERIVATLFGKINKLMPTRLGFRYVNAFSQQEHNISSSSDLALRIAAGGIDRENPASFALNYRRLNEASHIEQVQVATRDYVQVEGEAPDFSVLVDIDIFTPDFWNIGGEREVLQWIDFAHTRVRENFFELLPEAVIDSLTRG